MANEMATRDEALVARVKEECAKLAERFDQYTGAGNEDTNDLVGMFGRGNRNARKCIAAAIRALTISPQE